MLSICIVFRFTEGLTWPQPGAHWSISIQYVRLVGSLRIDMHCACNKCRAGIIDDEIG